MGLMGKNTKEDPFSYCTFSITEVITVDEFGYNNGWVILSG